VKEVEPPLVEVGLGSGAVVEVGPAVGFAGAVSVAAGAACVSAGADVGLLCAAALVTVGRMGGAVGFCTGMTVSARVGKGWGAVALGAAAVVGDVGRLQPANPKQIRVTSRIFFQSIAVSLFS
jgi:hypothetical protein